jgi:hypothetical protein
MNNNEATTAQEAIENWNNIRFAVIKSVDHEQKVAEAFRIMKLAQYAEQQREISTMAEGFRWNR